MPTMRAYRLPSPPCTPYCVSTTDKSSKGQFPIRWTAPEAMTNGRFNEASDVWSFGITLVELFANGARPYAGMGNAEVISKVQAGFRQPRPDACPAHMYSIMAQCWEPAAADRPSFSEIALLLAAQSPPPGTAAGVLVLGGNHAATPGQGYAPETVGYVQEQEMHTPRIPDEDSTSDGYEMPSAENMELIRQSKAAAAAANADAEGHTILSAKTLHITGQGTPHLAAMQQPATKPPAVVVNTLWDHEYHLSTQELTDSAHDGTPEGSTTTGAAHPTALQETEFGRDHEAVVDTQGGIATGQAG